MRVNHLARGFQVGLLAANRSCCAPSHRPAECKRRWIAEGRKGNLVCSADFSGDLLGPSLSPATTSTEDSGISIEEAVDAVELKSDATMDYSTLKGLLREGEFRMADDETRALLIRLAGEDAEDRGWVYFTEVASIPEADMLTIDALWKAASDGKFGYSVQSKIFRQKLKRWTKFFKAIDWTVGEDNNYRKWPTEFIYSLEATDGHLPLTNCLRGTQLLEEIMNHKAYSVEETEESSNNTMSNKDWTGF